VLFNAPRLPALNGTWALVDLVKLRPAVEQYGLKLSALETVSNSFFDHVILGGPRRDEQIENMITTVRNIARAGIPDCSKLWILPITVLSSAKIDLRNWRMMPVMSIYQKHNYDSFFIPDHVSRTFGDSNWGYRGRAFGLGYLQYLVESAE
jgi:D-mannonate dehydratase